MPRLARIFLLTLILITTSLLMAPHAQAQSEASFCVLAYEDANENSVRDPSEVPLPNVVVTVSTTEDVILRSHVTTLENRPYCFEGLPDMTYNLEFQASPNHRASIENKTPISGQRVRVEFGAVPTSPFEDSDAVVEGSTDDSLGRLPLAIGAGLLAFVLMTGLGVMIGGLLS